MKMNIYFKGLVVSLLLIAGMFTSCEANLISLSLPVVCPR